MNRNVFLKGWITGARLRGRGAAQATADAGGGSGEYDKASFLAGLAAGFASRGAPPWRGAIGELPGWVPENAVIHKTEAVENPPWQHSKFGPYDEIGVIFAADDGAVIQKSGVCVYWGSFAFVPAFYATYAIISDTEKISVADCYFHNDKLVGCDDFETLSFKVSGNVKYYQTFWVPDSRRVSSACIYGPTVFRSEAELSAYMGADIPAQR